ncbi:MAG: hypothetical protein FJY83_02450 [Candidatus Aminicenantes bacterium]|nr:hypothetical protein [Candidatus Aminicenantes bacterium]
MSTQYFFEGFKSKTTLDEEETRVLEHLQELPDLDAATDKARDLLEKDTSLGLTVISKHSPTGDHQGLKFIFRDKEGKLEEGDLYWGDWLCREG